MNRINNLTLIFTLLLSFSTFGKVSIQNVDFSKSKDKGMVTIKYDGDLKDYPELQVKGNTIQIIIPNSTVKRSIHKNVSFSTASKKDTTLKAVQLKKNTTQIKAVFPFKIKSHEESVTLTILDGQIELSFPKIKVKSFVGKTKKRVRRKSTKANAKIAKDVLNEDYLNSLIKQQKKSKRKATSIGKGKMPKIKQIFNRDEVKTTLAAPAKQFVSKGKSSFSLAEYGGKFVAFLGVVLLLFYGIVTVLKKGFFKKGKLGFLNNTNQVTVLSTTHIAPKKSLMMIKVHNQVFLVSNTDAGIHPISEINDVNGLLKEGERLVTGDNFDTNLGDADTNENNAAKITIKEDIMQSNKKSSLSNFIGVEDKVKFSDTLKKKVKSLKPLQ